MKKKYYSHIFDVGAYNGIDGLALAIKNPNSMIHAFEANPEMIFKIKLLKKKLEKRIGRKILNYKYYNFAVSKFNKYKKFYISVNPTVSSLNKFNSKLEKRWPGYKDNICKLKKKIITKVIRLDQFCKKNNIESIDYLHIDTQGSDLDVLKGLGDKIDIVKSGVLEAAISFNKRLYNRNHTLPEVKYFLKKKGFFLYDIKYVDMLKNEVNVFFLNKKQKNVSVYSNYNSRYFYRVLDDNTYFKDDLRDFFYRIFNNLIKTFS